MKHYILLLNLLAFALCSCASGIIGKQRAQMALTETDDYGLLKKKILISSPHNEMQVSLSPYKDFVLYSADDAGNQDIYIRSADLSGQSYQLTFHTAHDMDPRFSPDEEYVVFTSLREDAKGDIWIMRRDGSKKQKLTSRSSKDRMPVFSPDGLFVYYESQTGVDKAPSIQRINLKTKKSELVLTQAWNPAPAQDGYLFYISLDANRIPRLGCYSVPLKQKWWITDGAMVDGFPDVYQHSNGSISVIVTRFAEDSNRDGSIDGDDKSSIWRIDLSKQALMDQAQATPFPLSTGKNAEIFGRMYGNMVISSARLGSDTEAIVMSSQSLYPSSLSVEQILVLAKNAQDSQTKRILLRDIIARYPQESLFARYLLGKDLAENGLYQRAYTEFSKVIEQGFIESDIVQLVHYELIRLHTLQKTKSESESKHDWIVDQAIAELEEQRPFFTASSSVRNRYQIVLYELKFLQGNWNNLAVHIQNLLDTTLSAEDGARATWLLMQIYDKLQESSAAIRLAINLTKFYPSEKFYTQQAIDYIVLQASQAENPLAVIGSVLKEHTEIEDLFARLTIVGAKKNIVSGNIVLAKMQLQQLVAIYPKNSQSVPALFLLAQIEHNTNNTDRAIMYYEQLIDLPQISRQQQSNAKRLIVEIALGKARTAHLQGHINEAYQAYRKIIENSIDQVVAHRQYISLGVQLGKTEALLSYYKQLFLTHPSNMNVQYALALCLSYSENTKPKAVERILRNILDKNARFAPAHLTMGWIYEQRYMRSGNDEYLLRAIERYQTALSEARSQEIVAAANLNLGNAFLLLGKNDLAFNHYLEREYIQLPFANSQQELLYRLAFGKVAARLMYYDIALTQLNDGFTCGQQANLTKQYGETITMIAAVWQILSQHQKATVWFEKALTYYQRSNNSEQLAVALRGLAFNLLQLGDYQKAEFTFKELYKHLQEHPKVSNPSLGFFEFHTALEEHNISRAPYGFSYWDELEINLGALGEISLDKRQYLKALDFWKQKIQYLLQAQKQSKSPQAFNEEISVAQAAIGYILFNLGDYLSSKQYLLKSFQQCIANDYNDGAMIVFNGLVLLHRYGYHLAEETMAAGAKLLNSVRSDIPLRLYNNVALHLAYIHVERYYKSLPEQHQSIAALIKQLDEKNENLSIALDYAQLVRRTTEGSSPAYIYARSIEGHILSLMNVENSEIEHELTEVLESLNDAFMKWRVYYDLSQWGNRQKNLEKALQALLVWQPEKKKSLYTVDMELQGLLQATFKNLIAKNDQETIFKLIGLLRHWQYVDHVSHYTSVSLSSFRKILAFHDADYIFHHLLGETELWVVIDKEKLSAMITASGGFKSISSSLQAMKKNQQVIYCDFAHADAGFETLVRSMFPGIPRVHSASPQMLVHAWNNRNVAHQAPVFMSDTLAGKKSNAAKESNEYVTEQSLQPEQNRAIRIFDIPITIASDGTMTITDSHKRLSDIPYHDGLVLFTDVDIDCSLSAPINQFHSYRPQSSCNREHLLLTLAQKFIVQGASTVVIGSSLMKNALKEFLRDNQKAIHEGVASRAISEFYKQNKASCNTYGFLGLEKSEKLLLAKKQLGLSVRNSVLTFKRKQWQLSREYFEQAIELITFLEKSPLVLQEKLAEVFLSLEMPHKAILLQQEVVKQIPITKQASLAKSLKSLGLMQYNQDQYKQAAQTFKQAATIYGKLGDNAAQADLLIRTGTSYRKLYNFQDALTMYEQAASIYHKRNDSDEIKALRFAGFVLESNLSDYAHAKKIFKQAHILAKKIQRTEDILNSYNDLARIYRLEGDYEQALQNVSEALRLDSNTNSQQITELYLEKARIHWYRGEYDNALISQKTALSQARIMKNTFLEIQSISLAGLIARNQGQLEKAEQLLLQALAMAQNTSRLGEVAAQRNNLGIVYREQGELERAIGEFKKALAIDEQSNNQEGIAYDLRNLGVTLLERKQYEDALPILKRALKISVTIKNRFNELECAYGLGRLYAQTGDNQNAWNYYLHAQKQAQQLSVPEVEWKSLYALASLPQVADDTSQRSEMYYDAVAIVEGITRAPSKFSQKPSRKELYGQLITLEMKAKHYRKAFNLFIRFRQRLFLDYATRYMKLHKVQDLQVAINSFFKSQKNGQLVNFSGQTEDHAALVLFDTHEGIASWWIQNNTITQANFSSFNHNDFYNLIQDISAAMEGYYDVSKQLKQLSDMLLQPYESNIDAIKSLGIATVSPFYEIPFQALPVKDSSLVEQGIATYQISNFLRGRFPDVSNTKPSQLNLAMIRGDNKQLPFILLEQKAVQREVHSLHMVSDGINELEKLFDFNNDINVLHIAAHTKINTELPLESYINVSNQPQSSLHVAQIISLTMPQIVTLSACQTDATLNDGWLGFSRSFLMAGAHYVIAASHRITDSASAMLMKRFYRYMLSTDITSALLRAQQDVRKYYHHPGHWASYRVVAGM